MSDSSPRERYSWSSREIEILIAMWDNEEVLYNTRCNDYFKRDKRIEALERISDTLKISIPEIRKKMTNLRTYYGKELWKEKKAHMNGDESYSSRWLFFKSLDFLRFNCNPKHKTETDDQGIGDDGERQLNNGDDDDNNDCETSSWDESNLLASLTTVEDTKEPEEGNLDNSMANVNREDNPSPVSKRVEKRKKSGADLEHVIAKLQRSSRVVPKEPKKVSIPELMSGNPDMVFAHHVGLSLMNIKNQRVKDLTKLKIQTVLYETQYVEDTPQPVQAFPITALQGN